MFPIGLRLCLLSSLLFLLGCEGGGADPDLRVLDPWARPRSVEAGMQGPVSGFTSAVYLVIHNRGRTPDRLLGGTTPVAESVEVHETLLDGDIMRMRQVDALDLQPGDSVALRPGGFHLMLLNLRRSLVVGDTLSLTLTFQDSSPLPLRVPVRGVGEGE